MENKLNTPGKTDMMRNISSEGLTYGDSEKWKTS